MKILIIIAALTISALAQDLPSGDELIPARITTTPRVNPPAESVESGLGGNVRVLLKIDEGGNVISVEDVTGPGTVCRQVTRADVVAMRNATREAALLARFTPAIRNGKPVSGTVWLNFYFPGDGERTIFIAETDPEPRVPPPPPPPTGAGPTGGIAKQIAGRFLNGKATSLFRPAYPPAARAVRASGAVSVQVLIDEGGQVFSAQAISGHPLLRSASTMAACESQFSPTLLSGQPVKVSGIITYNFVP